jgi:diguanylate cyclase (GGDEF)-like protein/PAS domain S-box-containing protein
MTYVLILGIQYRLNSKTLVTYLFYSLLIAGVYYGFGIIVRPLILPPIFAAPIWPPAGIGVSVLILWGYRYIPAIVLGEILINIDFYKVENFIDQPSLFIMHSLMLIAIIIRSALGAYLVRNHLGLSNNYLTLQSVVKLFILAGVIPTFLSSAIAIFAMASGGLLNENSLLISFSTWWLGDALGVFIIVPLMFLLFKKPRNVWKPRLLGTVIPTVVTFFLLIIVSLSLNKLEQSRLEEKLLNTTDRIIDEVFNRISNDNPILNGKTAEEIEISINKLFIRYSKEVIQNEKLQDIHFVILSMTENSKSIKEKIFESTNKSRQTFAWNATRKFKYANHEWRVMAYATEEYFLNHSTWLLWWLLSIGCIFIALMTAGLLIITGNNIIINDVVVKRTNEINKLNDILKESTKRYKQLVDIQPVIFWKHVFGDDMLEFVSNEAVNILGYSKKELLSLDVIFDKVFHPDDRNRIVKEYYEGIKTNKRFSLKYRALTKTGEQLWFKDYISIKKRDKKIEVIGLKIDITKDQKKEQKITQLAYFDDLTQLPNRVKFIICLRKSKIKAVKNDEFGGILYLNLNRFKVLNDSMGRFFGDKLLIQIAKRIKSTLRKTDIVSRFAGDEFVILLNNQSKTLKKVQHNTLKIAEKIQHVIKQPFTIDGHHFYTSCSIGISIFSAEIKSVEQIIQQANIAMYVAKNQDKNRIVCFENHMQDDANKRLEIEKSLKLALIRHEFEMHYQPIFNRYKETIKLEALIRWRHPEKGMIFPSSFIHIAEETGFISELSEWIIDSVFEQISIWNKIQNIYIPVAINISLYQFVNTHLIETLVITANKYKVDTGQITLELTESIGVENFQDTLKRLNQLKYLGFKLAIDDFGTGYSSLNYLSQMPLDILKIDKSFVSKIGKDNNSDKLIETIWLMSKQLNLDVIVEGVETEEQFTFLKNLGFQEFQGYLVSKAQSIKDLNLDSTPISI